jgi:ribose transport system ATP-binding protein
MAETEPIIALANISKRFGGVVALDAVSMEVQAGELHAICGENGAGKSTLMKILAGVLTDFDGEYRLNDKPVRFNGTRDAEQAGVSIIHQELNLVEQLSAAGNIFLGREIRNRFGLLNNAAMNLAAGELLASLECQVAPDTLAGTLRVGDQQLIEIAKALSLQANILIMDEPTSALTEAEVARLFRVIERLRGRGVTILYISHKMDEIFKLADRITVLRDGRLVETVNRAATTPQHITHAMVGREIEAAEHHAPRTPGETLLEVRGLSLAWPAHARKWRLQDIRFSLRRGEILGIAGLMGAGRTELLECLFGAASEPVQGDVLLRGKAVRFKHPAEARAAGIAMVTEDRKRLGLFTQMKVRENVTLCTLHEVATFGLINHSKETTVARDCATQLNLKMSGVEASIMSLSGGNQQKAVIGRWLLTKPDVLLLDDPTRGIDVGAKAELYRLMDQLCRQGLGMIVTSSELPELLKVSDRILVLCEGRQTAEFARSEANEQRIMEAATQRQFVSTNH